MRKEQLAGYLLAAAGSTGIGGLGLWLRQVRLELPLLSVGVPVLAVVLQVLLAAGCAWCRPAAPWRWALAISLPYLGAAVMALAGVPGHTLGAPFAALSWLLPAMLCLAGAYAGAYAGRRRRTHDRPAAGGG